MRLVCARIKQPLFLIINTTYAAIQTHRMLIFSVIARNCSNVESIGFDKGNKTIAVRCFYTISIYIIISLIYFLKFSKDQNERI